jgi:hypothetical protein
MFLDSCPVFHLGQLKIAGVAARHLRNRRKLLANAMILFQMGNDGICRGAPHDRLHSGRCDPARNAELLCLKTIPFQRNRWSRRSGSRKAAIRQPIANKKQARSIITEILAYHGRSKGL